ncbi:hypothetical protein ABPG74_021970 [Tetrahymena malaccensis]
MQIPYDLAETNNYLSLFDIAPSIGEGFNAEVGHQQEIIALKLIVQLFCQYCFSQLIFTILIPLHQFSSTKYQPSFVIKIVFYILLQLPNSDKNTYSLQLLVSKICSKRQTPQNVVVMKIRSEQSEKKLTFETLMQVIQDEKIISICFSFAVLLKNQKTYKFP